MTCQRHAISLAAGAIITLASTALGQAEPTIRSFDCPATIEEMIDAPEHRLPQSSALQPFLIAHSDNVELPDGNDIMNAEELGADYVLEGVFEAANGDGVVGCVLIAVRFTDPQGAGAEGRTISRDREIQPSRNGHEFLPILLMRRFDTEEDHRNALTSWQNDSFNIELLADDDPETQENEPHDLDLTRSGAPVPFGSYLVNSIQYLSEDLRHGQTRASASQFMVQDLPSDQQRHLTDLLGVPERRSVADMTVLICGPDPCYDLLPSSGAARALPQSGDLILTSRATSENGGTGLHFVPSEEIAETAVPPASEPPSTHAEEQINLTTVDGQERVLSRAEHIACLLDALGAEVSLNPEHQCPEQLLTAGPDSILIIDGPTSWRLEHRRPPEPRQIAVTLPNTVEAQSCAMDVFILDGAEGNSVRVELDPPADGSARGATFTGPWPDSLVPGGEVTLSLRPVDGAECGGPARELTVPVAEEIAVSLLPAGTARSALEIAHITAFLAADLRVDFDLDTALQDLLADQILAATSMAHVHLGQSIGTASSLISAAVFGRIGADGRPTTAAFTAAELAMLSTLAQTVYAGFEQVGFTHSAPNQPRDIERSIAQLAQEAVARGATALHVNLFGPVLSRTTVDPNAVCEDLRLAQELTLQDLPIPTTVAAYPLVGMAADEDYDLSDLAPLALPSGAERLPSGLMRCLNTGPDITILPFFIETWRSPRDLPARYATAIGDHLATALIATVAELEARP